MDRWFILCWGGERLKVNMVGNLAGSETGAKKSHGRRAHCDPSPQFHFRQGSWPSPRAVPSKRAVNGGPLNCMAALATLTVSSRNHLAFSNLLHAHNTKVAVPQHLAEPRNARQW